VLRELPQRITEVPFEEWQLPEEVKATLVLASEQLLEFHFSGRDQPSDYEHILAHPQHICFARYEVVDDSLFQPIHYSFTAENPSVRSDPSDVRVSIRLSADQAWTPSLIEWVLNRHYHGKQILAYTEPYEISETITQLSTGTPA
jgi:hypothetical protein